MDGQGRGGQKALDDEHTDRHSGRHVHGVGEPGNLCHVDCSNRGFCDHETGQCKCFQGFYGHNCHYKDALAVQIEI